MQYQVMQVCSGSRHVPQSGSEPWFNAFLSHFSLTLVHVSSSSQCHSFPGFQRGMCLPLHSEQSSDKVFGEYAFFQCLTSLSCHSPFWSRELGSKFVMALMALLQLWLSTPDTGATSQFSSPSICAANPSLLHNLAFPYVKWTPLYSRVFVKQVVVRTQSSVVLTWTNVFWPRFASWAHFGVTYGACTHRNCDSDLILSS